MMDLLQRMRPVAQGRELAVANKGHVDRNKDHMLRCGSDVAAGRR